MTDDNPELAIANGKDPAHSDAIASWYLRRAADTDATAKLAYSAHDSHEGFALGRSVVMRTHCCELPQLAACTSAHS